MIDYLILIALVMIWLQHGRLGKLLDGYIDRLLLRYGKWKYSKRA